MTADAGRRTITVTVDYNGHADTLACLATIRGSCQPHMPVIVVDNGSQPPLSLPDDGPDLNLIRHEENLGFARGFNAGIRAALDAGADAVFVLNNDTLIAADMWPPLMEALFETRGIVAPRIYYAADPQRIWSAGYRMSRWTLQAADRRRSRLDAGPRGLAEAVDAVTGCAMLVDRRVFDRVGLFDERFFAYYEDLDFCLRARQAGFRIATVPNARLWHKVASTTGLGTPRREYLMARSSVVFYARHAAWRLPFVVAARTGSLLKTLAVHARRSRPDLIRAHLSGLRDGLHDVFDKSPAR